MLFRSHERSLTLRGTEAVQNIGVQLKQAESWIPDLYLCSTALRARQTFAQMKQTLEYQGNASFVPFFYSAGVQEILDCLMGIEDKYNIAMIIGHNPTWSNVISGLSGCSIALSPSDTAMMQKKANSWAEAFAEGSWECVKVLRPTAV